MLVSGSVFFLRLPSGPTRAKDAQAVRARFDLALIATYMLHGFFQADIKSGSQNSELLAVRWKEHDKSTLFVC